jgi:phosphoadenosine phosphosulfate reductase
MPLTLDLPRAPRRCPGRGGAALGDGWAPAQTPGRADTPVVSAERRGDRTLVKVAALAGWSDADVADRLVRHDLPSRPLADAGSPSFGCAPCSWPATPDGDPGAGRWPGGGESGCGIHLEYDPEEGT